MARRRTATPLLILALGPVFQACESSDSGAPLVTHHDSAGIRIIESYQPLWGDSSYWHIDPEPVLDLSESGTGDPHRFYQVRGMKRLSDGSLVVVNGGSDEIRQFSAEGHFVGSAGGPGEGPGEFSNIQQLELVGDTMLVLDYDGRVTVFDPGPTLVRVMRPHHGISTIYTLSKGRFVAEILMEYSAATGLVRAAEALQVYDLEGARLDSIGETAGHEEFTDNETFSATPLFAKYSHVDTQGERIFYGASDLMQVEELSANGDLVRILRIPGYPLALTEAQVEAERDSRLDLGVPIPPQYREMTELLPSPETRPAYADLLVDPTGAVWLRPFLGTSERGGPELWTVLDPSGAWLGSVGFPPPFRVTEIGTDEVLGIWSDELDVQHPRVMRLRREGG